MTQRTSFAAGALFGFCMMLALVVILMLVAEPHCPNADSCVAEYDDDHGWQIREVGQ